jgi:hypothetical protein
MMNNAEVGFSFICSNLINLFHFTGLPRRKCRNLLERLNDIRIYFNTNRIVNVTVAVTVNAINLII